MGFCPILFFHKGMIVILGNLLPTIVMKTSEGSSIPYDELTEPQNFCVEIPTFPNQIFPINNVPFLLMKRVKMCFHFTSF